MGKKRPIKKSEKHATPSRPSSRKFDKQLVGNLVAQDTELPPIFNLSQFETVPDYRMTIGPQPELVTMLGEPLLTRTLESQSTMIPSPLRSHPLIKNKCFYTLPPELLRSLEVNVSALSKDNELWSMEKTLSGISGDHAVQVGFVDSRPLSFGLLRPTQPLNIPITTSAVWRGMGINSALVEKTYQKRSKWYNTIARGYAGWLNSNPDFRRERNDALGANLRTVTLFPDKYADAAGDSLPEQVRNFLVRWRLLGMAGPRLPVPQRPMLGGQFPLTILSQLMAAGGVFNIPDTYPIPSRDELREMLEDAVRSAKPEHLREWNATTHKRNFGKNKIERYSRLFELQHYWELLHERHRTRLDRQLVKIQDVLAQFFHTSEESIKADLRLLRQRLGTDWPA